MKYKKNPYLNPLLFPIYLVVIALVAVVPLTVNQLISGNFDTRGKAAEIVINPFVRNILTGTGITLTGKIIKLDQCVNRMCYQLINSSDGKNHYLSGFFTSGGALPGGILSSQVCLDDNGVCQSLRQRIDIDKYVNSVVEVKALPFDEENPPYLFVTQITLIPVSRVPRPTSTPTPTLPSATNNNIECYLEFDKDDSRNSPGVYYVGDDTLIGQAKTGDRIVIFLFVNSKNGYTPSHLSGRINLSGYQNNLVYMDSDTNTQYKNGVLEDTSNTAHYSSRRDLYYQQFAGRFKINSLPANGRIDLTGQGFDDRGNSVNCSESLNVTGSQSNPTPTITPTPTPPIGCFYTYLGLRCTQGSVGCNPILVCPGSLTPTPTSYVPSPTSTPTPTVPSSTSQVTMSLYPKAQNIALGNGFTGDILLDTAGKKVTAVDLRLQFNPADINFTTLGANTSFFPELLSPPSIDNINGTARIVVGTGSRKSVSGPVAVGSFYATAKQAKNLSAIAILPTSKVSALDYSNNVLEVVSNMNLTIYDSTKTIPGDVNHDGMVDIYDYNLVVQNFGSTTCGVLGDANADCKIDIYDFNIVVQNFGLKLSTNPSFRCSWCGTKCVQSTTNVACLRVQPPSGFSCLAITKDNLTSCQVIAE